MDKRGAKWITYLIVGIFSVTLSLGLTLRNPFVVVIGIGIGAIGSIALRKKITWAITDERLEMIQGKAAYVSYRATLIASVGFALPMILLDANKTIYSTILFVACFLLVVYVLFFTIYRKRYGGE